MNEVLNMIETFAAGTIIGILYFGGLWFTVKKGVTSKTPALLFSLSFIFRSGITLFGFYYFSSGDWRKLIACLIGFIAARFIIIRVTKLYEQKQIQLKKEVAHEA